MARDFPTAVCLRPRSLLEFGELRHDRMGRELVDVVEYQIAALQLNKFGKFPHEFTIMLANPALRIRGELN